ncbi:MAG: tail fiber domain-containing protein [Phycisphaerales bacterium]|nr:tail fiber domain-containing protein [Planctomycetota bacterium]MCH8508396.1 tail fiber domain-containing protein [Phycisphaerales bacterium]
MLNRTLTAAALLAALAWTQTAGASDPNMDAFTYQAELRLNGQPVLGPVNLSFRLYNTAVDGQPIGPQLDAFGYEGFDEAGRFTMDLDFGKNLFDGSPLWLEIRVDGAPLEPRQKIMPTPYAVRALDVAGVSSDALSGQYASQLTFSNPANQFAGSGANLTSLNASNLSTGTIGSALLSGTYSNPLAFSNASGTFTGIFNGTHTGNGVGLTNLSASNINSGTLPNARLSGTYSSSLTFSNASGSFSGSFSGSHSGSGASLTQLNAGSISSGTLSFNRLPTSGQWNIDNILNIGNSTLVINPTNGRVAIGTSNPIYPLHVVSQQTYGIFAVNQSASGVAYGVRGSANSPDGRGGYFLASSTSGANRALLASTSSPEGFAGYFTGPSGSANYFQRSVGIGTNAPGNMLTVSGPGTSDGGANAAEVVGRVRNTSNAHTAFAVDARSGRDGILYLGENGDAAWGIRHNSTGNRLDFRRHAGGTNDTFMTIRSDGRVGIGNASPSDQLMVDAPAGTDAFRVRVNSGTKLRVHANGGVSVGSNYSSTVPENGLQVRGNVLIGNAPIWGGVTPPALEVTTGISFFHGLVRIEDNAPNALILTSGGASKPGGGLWAVWSDERLKQHVAPLRPGTLDRLLRIQGYTYEYTEEAIAKKLGQPGLHTGLIAQEAAEHFPDWVKPCEDGYLTVSETGLTAILVESIRELRAEKDAQLAERDAHIDELRAELHDLRALVIDLLIIAEE